MALLSRRQILAIHQAGIRVGLSAHRDALLSGIDARVVAGLAMASSPAAQMLLDLTALDAIGRPTLGACPLKTWLDNAAILVADQPETESFRLAAEMAAGATPSRSMEATLAQLWTTDDDLRGLSAEIGIAPDALPEAESMAARLHYLLIDLTAKRDQRCLSALAAAVRRRAPSAALLAEEIDLLSASTAAGDWPEDIDEAWIGVQRRGKTWRIDYQFPGIDVRGSMEFRGQARRRLTPELELSAEPADAGVLLQLLGDRAGPLVGATARIWAGLRSISKTLRPWADDRLGDTTNTLLTSFVELEDSDEVAC